MKYTYTMPPPKWYDKIIPRFFWDLYYRLKFNLYTVHTTDFKLWMARHKHIENLMKDK